MQEEEEKKRKEEEAAREQEEYLRLKEGFTVEEEGVDSKDDETQVCGSISPVCVCNAWHLCPHRLEGSRTSLTT